MIYESLLERLTAKRRLNRAGFKSISASEVSTSMWLSLPSVGCFSTTRFSRLRALGLLVSRWAFRTSFLALLRTCTQFSVLLQVFMLGSVAKLGATLVTYPLLVIKVLFPRHLSNEAKIAAKAVLAITCFILRIVSFDVETWLLATFPDGTHPFSCSRGYKRSKILGQTTRCSTLVSTLTNARICCTRHTTCDKLPTRLHPSS